LGEVLRWKSCACRGGFRSSIDATEAFVEAWYVADNLQAIGGSDLELTIEGGAVELDQAIGTAARPIHLLRFFRNGKCRLSLINDDGT
jgi:hypothetical protein